MITVVKKEKEAEKVKVNTLKEIEVKILKEVKVNISRDVKVKIVNKHKFESHYFLNLTFRLRKFIIKMFINIHFLV